MPRRRAATILLAATTTTLLASCSTGDHPAQPHETGATATAANASAPEIAFAQMMIPHHEQAVAMSELALQPQASASAEVRAFAEQIRSAQAPEIEQMTAWLDAWGAPTTMPTGTPEEHSGHDMGGISEHGMMSDADMAELAEVRGGRFDELWLRMMIEHHEGAIVMSEQVKAQSTNPEVVNLANAIITTQRQEIGEMKQALE